MKNNLVFFLVFITSLASSLQAQDVDSLLNALTTPAADYESATFKATRIINGHSIEQMKQGQLDARFHHRFGQVNSGAYEFWGLDQANVFLSLEYGVTDWLMLGAGRTSYEKTYNSFAKFRLLRQSGGTGSMPVAISAYTGLDVFTTRLTDLTRPDYFSSRMSYIFQGLVARKFNDDLSLQLSPTVIHRNFVEPALETNDIFAIGVGGRYKLSTRISFNAEYFYVIEPSVVGSSKRPNSLSFGFDIETGGHVFQIILTNSVQMTERGFIGGATGEWGHGDIHFGFNISRVFAL